MKKLPFYIFFLILFYSSSLKAQSGGFQPIAEELKALDFIKGEWESVAYQLNAGGEIVSSLNIRMETLDLIGGRALLTRGYINENEVGNTTYFYNTQTKKLNAVSIDAFGNYDVLIGKIEGDKIIFISEPRKFPNGSTVMLKREFKKLSNEEHEVNLFVSNDNADTWIQNFRQVQKKIN